MLSEVSEVWLQYDEDPQDTYGRELCYVWLKGDVDISAKNDIKKYMVNALLLRKGYVYTSVYEPNDTYERLFYKLERVARKNKRGLWKYKQFRTIVDEKRK